MTQDFTKLKCLSEIGSIPLRNYPLQTKHTAILPLRLYNSTSNMSSKQAKEGERA